MWDVSAAIIEDMNRDYQVSFSDLGIKTAGHWYNTLSQSNTH